METKFGGSSRIVVIAAAAAVLTAACAVGAAQPSPQAAKRDARQCFLVSQVNGFNAVNRDTVQVSVGASTIYQLELFGGCPEIDWSQRIGIRSTGGSSWACSGLDAELIVPSPLGVQRCQVSSIRQLTPAEVQASRAKRKR